jgi:hypothetical protein
MQHLAKLVGTALVLITALGRVAAAEIVATPPLGIQGSNPVGVCDLTNLNTSTLQFQLNLIDISTGNAVCGNIVSLAQNVTTTLTCPVSTGHYSCKAIASTAAQASKLLLGMTIQDDASTYASAEGLTVSTLNSQTNTLLTPAISSKVGWGGCDVVNEGTALQTVTLQLIDVNGVVNSSTTVTLAPDQGTSFITFSPAPFVFRCSAAGNTNTGTRGLRLSASALDGTIGPALSAVQSF